MKIDKFGTIYYETDEVFDLLYSNPKLDLSNIVMTGSAASEYNAANRELFAKYPKIVPYSPMPDNFTVEEVDQARQSIWKMPQEYLELDIADWVLKQCKTDEELQRVGAELLLYQERDMFNLLRYMKYFVDTMREHKLVWGVGRGSSVASYVLFLIGVHKVDSIFYSLDINEFLK